jgi:hypothetical protein
VIIVVVLVLINDYSPTHAQAREAQEEADEAEARQKERAALEGAVAALQAEVVTADRERAATSDKASRQMRELLGRISTLQVCVARYLLQ